MALINGTAGNDTLAGTGDADTINGFAGDDRLTGLGGNDTLDGGQGADTLSGGDGDDVLRGGTITTALNPRDPTTTFTQDDGAADLLDGGAGVDTLVGGLEDTLNGGAGDDVINATYRFIGAGPGGGSIDGGAGADTITVIGGTETVRTGAGADLVSVLAGGATTPFTVTILDFTASGPERDRLRLDVGQGAATDAPFPLVTAQGGDVLVTFQGSPQLTTVVLKGVDAAQLTAANFVGFTPIIPAAYATGGDGADMLTGGAVNDAISGLGGDDVLVGLGGDDVLQGGAGLDRLDGGDGNDRLIGGDGADTLTGGAGNDRIEGGGGDDVISGGDGDDVLVDNEVGSTAQIDGGAGDDLIIAFPAKGRIDGGSGIDRILSRGQLDLSQVSVSGVEVLDGGVVGTAAQLAAFSAFGSGSSLTLSAAATLDVRGKVLPFSLPDIYVTRLVGSDGDDALIGGAEIDALQGGKGRDTLTGGAGTDSFDFGAGESIAGAIDSITDFSTGEDTLQLSADAVSLVRVGDTATLLFGTLAGSPQTVVGINGTIQGTDLAFGALNTAGINFVGRDNASDTLIGSNGPDTLFGLSGSDSLVGGAGDDQLFGDAGADVLTGGAGADRFAYRGVADSNAAMGYDIITDFVSGTDKIDLSYLNGVSTVSLVRSGGATFLFAATSGGQVQIGLTGAVQAGDLINPIGAPATFGYQIVGDAPGETLTGSAGADTLFGLGGADVLIGGAGADILYGDAGADVLTGGAGADVFAYRGPGDSPLSGFDVITDFVSGTDKIDLRGVHLSAADRFGIAYQNGSALLFLDQGGDGVSELLIVLQGVASVQASDILF